MKGINQTSVYDIVIIGFEGPLKLRILMTVILFLLYLMTLGINSLIVVLVTISRRLHSPMYFFLCHLAITDMVVPSNIVPNLLYVTLLDRGTISLPNCLAQFFFFGMAADAECLILTLMSYDSWPYILLATSCWVLAFAIALFAVCYMLTFEFCDSNVINHLFCDLHPVLNLSCSDIFIVDIEVLVAGTVVVVLAFVFIVVTYVWIFRTILGSSMTTGKQKAFSTCTSHLTVVCTYYATLLANYLIPLAGMTTDLAKYISLLYTVITPLMNPIIYRIRNREIRSALNSFIH
ncbi:hypothetical protein XENTR_v10010291 [Xenopus tropicalis]|nr:hypothetical protein XENTR_v10010291 [Xenopus tropicalis]